MRSDIWAPSGQEQSTNLPVYTNTPGFTALNSQAHKLHPVDVKQLSVFQEMNTHYINSQLSKDVHSGVFDRS